jgi:ribonuclease D
MRMTGIGDNVPMTTPEIIQSESELESLASRLRDVELLAVDTEFVRESTYYPRPCLLQLAWHDRLALVDLLKLGTVAPLKETLFQQGTLKIFHAARQDLELFFSMSGHVPDPVYDTQIAGALLGYPDQSGYGPLVQEILGVSLEKGHARTDWSRRPLSENQLRYAAEDVLYLLPLYRKLETRLGELGRQEWCREMSAELTEPALYRPDPDSAWSRVRNWRQLEGVALARLQALAAWREEQAVARDRPRKWILGDAGLIELARENPRSESGLERLSIPPAVRRRQGATILRRLEGVPAGAEPRGVSPEKRLTRNETRLVSSLGQVVDETARRKSIAAPALATRAELRALVAGQRELRILRGWRRELVGERLLAMVEAAGDQPSGKEGTSAATRRS